ncbi:GTPase-activating protein gyp8 [Vermiconidia calcicola]|uniref:GTPase-activating protein gyp8 n=1 Tax=Vermiconidia calcicola TaxID=1690605 RepID=A0ACC3MDE1_9PEZI|nr:GTPase-activating protein gyp8 [Vermiconidia calcicola]
MSGTEPHLHLLPAVLFAADPTLARHLSQTQPFFALSATLTLYAHEIEEYGSISRLFDFLLANEAVVSVYLFAVVVISRKDELLEIEAEEPEMLHSILSKLPKPLDLDSLIQRTVSLFREYPPEKLPGRTWSRISSNSVLKTTRDFHKLSQQTLSDGERYFKKEAAEIQRRDVLMHRQRQVQALARRYRRPVTWTGAAVFAAIFALYFRNYSPQYSWAAWGPVFVEARHRLIEFWHRLAI